MPQFKELFLLLGSFSHHVVTEADPEMARIARLSCCRRGNLASNVRKTRLTSAENASCVVAKTDPAKHVWGVDSGA